MTRVQEFLSSERAIQVLVALFIVLGTVYSVVNPIFEAGDELWHYPHVQWIATGHGLPIQDPSQEQLWEQEGGQPPLYYLTSAALTFWVNTDDMRERLWRNPYAQIGVPLAFGNKNMVVHTPAENFPWQGTTLAVHLIRLLSVLFSAGTVYLTYKITLEILAARKSATTQPSNHPTIKPSPLIALFAASFVAFNPMFLFISASVNNDSLAALLATSSILLCVRLVTRGVTNGRVLVLGILVGLAILTKVSNVALGVVAVTVILYAIWRQLKNSPPPAANFLRVPLISYLRHLIYTFVVFGVLILVLCGWWFARNYSLYGDPLAFNVWMQIAGGRPPQTLLGLLGEFQGFRISYWGNFGGVNIIAPDWVYTALDAAILLGFVGLALGAARRRLPVLLWIPTLHLVVVFLALIRWTLMTYASQGRLMFPAIAAFSILLAVGLVELARFGLEAAQRASVTKRVSPIALPALLTLFLAGFALAAPFTIIAPVYAQPARITDETTVPNPVHITYDAGADQPELVGYAAPRRIENNQLPITLYWRTASPITADLAFYIHAYDINGNSLGQWDAYPGNGIFPPRLWTPNEIIKDEYVVPLKSPDGYPFIGRVEVGMTRVGSSTVLPARNPQGETITPSLTTFKFVQPPASPAAPRVTFGDQFNLLKASASQGGDGPVIIFDLDNAAPIVLTRKFTFHLQLDLQARQIPDADYTLFAHIVDANGTILSQRDSQPRDNTYPTTLWDANEQFQNTLWMNIPADASPGMYTLEIGMYRAADLQRLPTNGNPWGVWKIENDHLIAPVEIK